MPIFDRSSPLGSPDRRPLDTAPYPPPDQIKPSMTLPGDSTMSILGAPNVNGEGGIGVAADSPTGRAYTGVMMMMQGANIVQSVIPGAIPPPLFMMIEKLSQIVPEIVRGMQQQMTGPGGMLSTMGMGAMGGDAMGGAPSMNPMAGGGPAGAPIGEGRMPPMY